MEETEVRPPTQILKPELLIAPIQPYSLARSAHHLFAMARQYTDEKDSSLTRQYLYCVAIELGMKAALLNKDSSAASRSIIKKQIRHDLARLIETFRSAYDLDLFDGDDLTAIAKINPYFEYKDLEYFEASIVDQMATGRRDLPTLEALEAASGKVDAFLAERKFFREG
jgi:hypothetical protein